MFHPLLKGFIFKLSAAGLPAVACVLAVDNDPAVADVHVVSSSPALAHVNAVAGVFFCRWPPYTGFFAS
jgi:hypothetical protein